jgi:hypothetical protein
MLRTTNAAGRIRDESLMNLGGRAFDSIGFNFDMLCHTYTLRNYKSAFIVNFFNTHVNTDNVVISYKYVSPLLSHIIS